MTSCTKYEIDLLQKVPLKIDRLIEYVARENTYVLQRMSVPSQTIKGFYNVTPDLIDKFKREANSHVKQVLEKPEEYGLLYDIADQNSKWVNSVYFDYENFPLMQDKYTVLKKIRTMAQRFSQPNTHHFDATCLYYLYFYALLVNPQANWVLMEHLATGNRYHQYGTYLNVRPVVHRWITPRDKDGNPIKSCDSRCFRVTTS